MAKTPKAPPKPPRSLGEAGRELWRRIQAQYRIDDAAGLALLRTAGECRDLDVQAMTEARRDGLVITDKYGQKRSHPCLTVARDARQQMLSALRAMNLDIEPLRDRQGRP